MFRIFCPDKYEAIEQIYGGVLQLKCIVIPDNKTFTIVILFFLLGHKKTHNINI